MRRVLTGIVGTAAAAAAVVTATPAMAAPAVDQTAAVSSHGAGYSAWVFQGQTMAQPFTAGITGGLTQADLSMAPFGANQTDLTVSIYSMSAGVPVGSALASTVIPTADIQAMTPDRNLNTLTVNFSTPAAVTAGQQYAIVAETTEGYHWFMSSDDWSYSTTWSLYGNSSQGVASTNWAQFLAGAYVTWVDAAWVPSGNSGSGSAGGPGNGSTQWALTFSSKGEERTAVTEAGSPGWMPLPLVESSARSDERFLGWSTSPDFPARVAAEQLQKGWGAIDDVFDGKRMIFIPAGAWTQISGSNHFYGIWG